MIIELLWRHDVVIAAPAILDCFPSRSVGKLQWWSDDGLFWEYNFQLFVGQQSHENNSSS